MTSDELIELARERRGDAGCTRCSILACTGWESLGGDFDRANLRNIATLRDAAIDEPTYAEYHPAGTNSWSADAPIALAWFPYNRCDVWECTGCGKPFLRYTEYGGYYADERIRELQADRIHQP